MFITFFAALPATAQNTVWVQVEAQPTLTAAQDRVRAYAADLEDVAGFYLGSGWYGIVLGPYSRDDADTLRRRLRSEGRIPRDAFIAVGDNFRQQFWPIGVGAATTAQPLPDADTSADVTAEAVTQETDEAPVEPVVAPEPVIAVPDETVAEARASEAALSRPEKELLQIALKWAGFYEAAIDGAFGRGTRASMRAWQDANNHEDTGVLTTAQRSELIDAYNAVLRGMDLQMVRDDATGIEMVIPTGVVEFAEYEPPFARFDAKGDLQARVLLISQEGDQDRLFGLYEILQTLAIVPMDGPRSRDSNSFVLEGIGDGIHSYTTATLRDGQIKGFSLIWPQGDEERRSRVLQNMQASFNTIPGVLDPAIALPDEDQAVDLVAGLAVRKPSLSRSGFYVDGRGSVLTTSEAVQGCERISIDDTHDADVVHLDDARGLAVLRPQTALAPLGVAAFQTSVPRLQSEVAVSGYPYGGVLAAPSLTFGKLADIRGLNGEEEVKRLALAARDGDAGGPVFDNGGAVLGMLLPRTVDNGQVLPRDTSFAVDATEIITSLGAAGISIETTDTVAFMPPETLTLRATDVTVLVSCW
ncbi:trypsin-like peptidase domain-containing protein [Yoonia sp. 208BN28-4]|uniref:trypsin-like peptidase domain-containing protein n=1 Tax=Yoonia sp. 208BN28-4 TaxID=3126505 RepID=UPI0030AA54F3